MSKGSLSSSNTVESVGVTGTGKMVKVIVQSSRPLAYRTIAQNDPPGVFIYLTAPTLCKEPPMKKVFGDLLEEVRMVYKDAVAPTDRPIPLEYILLKLKEPARFTVTQKDWILVMDLVPKGAGARDAAPSGKTEYALPAVPVRRKKPLAVLPPDPTLKDFIDVGLANHVPLKLAEAEYGVALFRYAEAIRTMFPSFVGKYEQSNGTLLLDPTKPSDDTKFKRKELGLQIGQPLFQSGRLYYSMRQASAQRQMSGQNMKKVKAELVLEITRAYYNLIKAQHSLKARRDLLQRASKVREMTQKKKQLELITAAEALGVESQYSQVQYRTLSDEKDLEIARLKLSALLNLPEPMPETIPDPVEPFAPDSLVDVTTPVESLVQLALRQRPDAIQAEYGARFGVYGAKAAKAEGRLRIDASGFLGRSGGAYEGEDLKLQNGWNVGVQASMFFLANSLKGTGAAEKTSPDLGESSRTESRSQSYYVGLLDGLKGVADRRQAILNREKALNEREQTRRNVEVEVREAYYNIQKAKIQFRGAQQELDYRQKELGISRQKEKMNLSEPTQTMAAESAFMEAQSGYEEAVAFYQVALAAIEKAVGVPLATLQSLK